MTDFSQQRIYKHRLLTCFSYLVSVFSGCKWCLLTNCISGAVVVQFRPSPGCLEVSGHDWIKIFLFCLAAVFPSHLFDHTTEFRLLWTRLLQFRLNGDCFLVILKISLWLLSGRFSCSCWLEEKKSTAAGLSVAALLCSTPVLQPRFLRPRPCCSSSAKLAFHLFSF